MPVTKSNHNPTMKLACHAKQKKIYTLRQWYFLVANARGGEVMFMFSVHTFTCQRKAWCKTSKRMSLLRAFWFN